MDDPSRYDVSVPTEVRERYTVNDVDTAVFLDNFFAPYGANVLVIGAHDEPSANILADSGFKVVGIDLRGYDEELPPCNYTFLKGDFCDLPPWFQAQSVGWFDAFVAVSAIEHFGMGAYGDRIDRYYDVVAMRKAWEYLRPGGRAFVTVPFGGHYLEVLPHWRVYDLPSARERLVQRFALERVAAATAHDTIIDSRLAKLGEPLTAEQVARFSGIPPSVSALLIMKKE